MFLRDNLEQVLARPIEPSHLYLDNRYIQFSHALCAAYELRLRGADFDRSVFSSLPAAFLDMLENEVNQTSGVPTDLMQIKIRAQNDAGPHWELPLRSVGEATYQIVEKQNEVNKLGTASLSQVLREAYPGAVYHYIAQAYRVLAVDSRNRKILCRREKRFLGTTPVCLTKVFPQLTAGLHELSLADNGFIAECAMQVSERVIGFSEKQGGSKPVQQIYGPGSPYAMQPLGRTFETTGVCWHFDGLEIGEETCERIKRAFCALFEIHDYDVGFGSYMAKQGPGDRKEVRGWCVYDATSGSLRLTKPLVAEFGRVLDEARLWAVAEDQQEDLHDIGELLARTAGLRPVGQAQALLTAPVTLDTALRLIRPGQAAVLTDQGLTRDVTVKGFRFTARGTEYELITDKPAKWFVPMDRVLPVEGVTELMLVDPDSGEEMV